MTIERPMFPPVDQARRHFLTVVASGTVAMIPTAVSATAPAVDPIYAAIDAHRQAVAAHDAVTDVRAAFNDVNMNDEQKAQLAVLEAAGADAWDQLDDAGCDLVNSKPTTLAGVAALCRYVEPLLNEKDTVNLPEVNQTLFLGHPSHAHAVKPPPTSCKVLRLTCRSVVSCLACCMDRPFQCIPNASGLA
ncbi:hypothetical protein V1279_004761 [Bradyrhizobium sp. AZCC 1610]